MKKLILVCMVCLIGGTVSAQGLDLGLKVGANFATINDATGGSSKTGFVVGAFAGAKLGDKMGIQADLLYSQQGADFELGDIDLSYVNIPVVLKYFVTERIHVHAGPQFGFVVADNVSKVINNLVEAESFDLTGVIGLGLDLPLGIRADGRYNFGLSDVFKSTDDSFDSGGKNAVFTISVGYSFL